MNKIDLKSVTSVHFIGIGGISMSALAQYCLSKKIKVSGSDSRRSPIINKLVSLGAKIDLKHKGSNIKTPDLVVYSGAIKCDNVERIAAAKKEIIMLERSEFLALVCSEFKNVIAIAGTHGKTTTTAMIARCFICAGLNPCVHLGGEYEQIGGNFLFNEGDFFITEACEYRKSFLTLKPTCSVVLNIESDHLECYENEEELRQTFKKFLKSGSEFNVCHSNLKQKNVITFSLDGKSKYYAKNILNCKCKQTFDVYENNEKMGNFSLDLIGEYNILNALACISVCRLYGISVKTLQKALNSFKGVKRRFEKVGEINDVEVYKDYAHHPTEIDVLLHALSERKENITVVFQPHTYSRTKSFFNQFVDVFCKYKHVKFIFYPTYAARERRQKGYESKDIFKSVSKKRENVFYCSNYASVKREVFKENEKKLLVVAVGAGDIENVGEYLIK